MSTLIDHECAAVLARLVVLWKGHPESTGVRSVAGDLAKAFAAKDEAFDWDVFWAAVYPDEVPTKHCPRCEGYPWHRIELCAACEADVAVSDDPGNPVVSGYLGKCTA